MSPAAAGDPWGPEILSLRAERSGRIVNAAITIATRTAEPDLRKKISALPRWDRFDNERLGEPNMLDQD